MNDDFVIVDAVEEDMPQIQKIYEHYVLTSPATFEETPPDVEEMKRRWKEITDAALPYLVAKYGDLVLGYFYMRPYRPRHAYRYTVEGSLYIAEEAGNRGVGSALLKKVTKLCKDKGYKQHIAMIGGSDNEASIKFHEKHGFMHVGVLKSVGYKFGAWVDIVVMQRSF